MAHKPILIIYTAVTIPCVVYGLTLNFKAIAGRDRLEIKEMELLFWAVIAQTILLLYILFVPFYSRNCKCWDRFGGIIHFISVHLVFLVIPMYVIMVSGTFVKEMRNDPNFTLLALFPILNASLILIYILKVFKIVKKTIAWNKSKNWHC